MDIGGDSNGINYKQKRKILCCLLVCSFDGKRKQKWEQCENYEEAIFKKKKIEDEVNNQVFLAPSNQINQRIFRNIC